MQKLLTFFSKKFQHIRVSLNINFNESLTNDIVSFEQLVPVGPDFLIGTAMPSTDTIYVREQKVITKC